MRFLRKALYYLLITATVISTSGCHKQAFDGNIDWNLHGVWVTADGVVQNERDGMDFSLSGTLPTEYELNSTVEMELNFVWPDAFGYQNEGMQTYTGGAGVADKHDNQSIYHGAGWLYDPEIHNTVSLGYTICPDEGFVVVHVGDSYLVASTDPNADPAKIFAFYKAYVHVSK